MLKPRRLLPLLVLIALAGCRTGRNYPSLALVSAVIFFAQPPADHCAVACPCTVPPGVDWRSARVMAPRARDQAAEIFLGVVTGADTLARDTAWMGEPIPGRRPIVSARTIRYELLGEGRPPDR